MVLLPPLSLFIGGTDKVAQLAPTSLPSAEAIRTCPDIHGFEVGPHTHKLSLFADDLVLFLTKPEHSLSHLQNLLQRYSSFSGYKVHFDKSEILPLSVFDHHTIKHQLPFRWLPMGLTYLGIMVDGNLNNLYKLNLASLLHKVEGDLCKWMDLPLTLLGRINVIQMNVLPRFLYLFQSFPIPVPTALFFSLDKLTRRFICHGKTPRVGLDKLTLDYGQGGLNLPYFRMYNWTAV